jgi:predicted Zn-dependent peptidase
VIAAVDKQLKVTSKDKPVLKCFSEPKQVKREYTEYKMPVGNPLYAIGIKDIELTSDPIERCRRSEALSILLHMLFSQSGEFYLDMLDRGLISPGFDFGYSSNATTAFVMISGESEDPNALLFEIKAHIAKCRATGLPAKDFEREKKCLYASYISDFDSSEDIAFSLNSYASDGMDMFLFSSIVGGIDLDFVTELLNTVFDEDAFTLSVVVPREE